MTSAVPPKPFVIFHNKDLIQDVDPGAGVFVVDVNCQGLWEDHELELMRWILPRVYSIYRKICITEYKMRPGTAVLIEENGYRVVLMFTKNHRHESKEVMLANFSKCVDNLFRLVPKNVEIYSPIIGRRDSKSFCDAWKIIKDKCTESGYRWNICRMQEKG